MNGKVDLIEIIRRCRKRIAASNKTFEKEHREHEGNSRVERAIKKQK